MTKLFPKSSWHVKRYLEARKITLRSDKFVYVTLRDYVSVVIGSLLNTYVFNSSLPITLIFLCISAEHLLNFINKNWIALLIVLVACFAKEHRFLRIVFHAYTGPDPIRATIQK